MIQNGELVAKSVQTGLSDGVHTEIIDGISVGDTLAVGLSLRSQDNNNNRSLISGSQAQY
jgi:HlyD family secretion protein